MEGTHGNWSEAEIERDFGELTEESNALKERIKKEKKRKSKNIYKESRQSVQNFEEILFFQATCSIKTGTKKNKEKEEKTKSN